MNVFPRLPRLLAGLLAAAAALQAPPLAADDELVVVDHKDLDAYWRADPRDIQSILLRDGPERYGCMALPFRIDTEGRLSPGTRPLLLRIGLAGGRPGDGLDVLVTMAMGSLPPFQPTWGAPPSDAIYSSWVVVIGDARIAERLGPDKWARVHEELQRACRIDDLAGWLNRYPGQVVNRPLPGDPEQLLSAPPEAPR